MNEIPDRFYIEENDKELYDKLLEEKSSPISRKKGFENKDIFLLALAMGYRENVTPSKLKKKIGYILVKYFSQEEMAILYALAVEKEGLDIVKEPKKVFQIAEEYANLGLNILYEKVNSGELGSFTKLLEIDLMKEKQNIKK
jgi:hypothetical protein